RTHIPKADAGGEANRTPPGIPGPVRDEHLDLAPAPRDRDTRRRSDQLAVGGLPPVGVMAVDGQEEPRRGGRVGAVWKRTWLLRAADRDRRRHEGRALHRV